MDLRAIDLLEAVPVQNIRLEIVRGTRGLANVLTSVYGGGAIGAGRFVVLTLPSHHCSQ